MSSFSSCCLIQSVRSDSSLLVNIIKTFLLVHLIKMSSSASSSSSSVLFSSPLSPSSSSSSSSWNPILLPSGFVDDNPDRSNDQPSSSSTVPTSPSSSSSFPPELSPRSYPGRSFGTRSGMTTGGTMPWTGRGRNNNGTTSSSPNLIRTLIRTRNNNHNNSLGSQSINRNNNNGVDHRTIENNGGRFATGFVSSSGPIIEFDGPESGRVHNNNGRNGNGGKPVTSSGSSSFVGSTSSGNDFPEIEGLVKGEFVSKKVVVSLSCEPEETVVRFNFTSPFRGAIQAGDTSSPCKIRGDGRKFYSLGVPHNSCGTKHVSSSGSFFNTLFIRYHPSLEMEGDQLKSIVCKFGTGSLSVG